MPRAIITVMVKPALRSRGLLVRLVEDDEKRSYYLSCWSLPWPSWLRESPEQLEDYQAQNWKRPIESAEAQQWIEALRYQTVPIAPEPEEAHERDGTSYEFLFEASGRKIHFAWDNEVPACWGAVWSLTQRLIEIARA